MIDSRVYASGQYVQHFRPEDAHNPFHLLYAAKQADVVGSVRRRISPGSAILDLGGGPGRLALPLATDYWLVLCDLSADMLRIASRSAVQHHLAPANLARSQLDAAQPLSFRSNSFDCALCLDLLIHVAQPRVTLAELKRVLKADGELLVDMSNHAPWWILRYPRALGRRPKAWLPTWRAGGVRPEWQGIVRHYTYTEYLDMLTAAGFEVIEEWRYGPAWCPKWFLTRCRHAQK